MREREVRADQEVVSERLAAVGRRASRVLVDPAQANTAESACAQLEIASRVVTTAAEAHNQLGKVEQHGHLFETVLVKMLDQGQVLPKNQEEYEQCIIQTMNAKNELLNNKGMSPCQRVFGR